MTETRERERERERQGKALVAATEIRRVQHTWSIWRDRLAAIMVCDE